MTAVDPSITTLIYAFRGDDVLLLRRRKRPNLGLWSPPGGKVEPGETPLDCALRELREETGLAVDHAVLRMVVSELDAITGDAWLTFGFVALVEGAAADADLHAADRPEGEPAWIPRAALATLAVPPADQHLMAAVVAAERGVAFARVRMAGGRLDAVDVRWG